MSVWASEAPHRPALLQQTRKSWQLPGHEAFHPESLGLSPGASFLLGRGLMGFKEMEDQKQN